MERWIDDLARALGEKPLTRRRLQRSWTSRVTSLTASSGRSRHSRRSCSASRSGAVRPRAIAGPRAWAPASASSGRPAGGRTIGTEPRGYP